MSQNEIAKCKCGIQPDLICTEDMGIAQSRVKCEQCGRTGPWEMTDGNAIQSWNADQQTWTHLPPDLEGPDQ